MLLGQNFDLRYPRAIEHGLVANGCSDDYGIDYFCQVLHRISSEVEEIRGDVLGVQVRSVKGGARPRIVLDKNDAETALRLECPYLLIGINVNEKKISFRFLDTEFAERLAIFIDAPEETLTLRVNGEDFQSANFRQLLARHCRPGTQHQLRLRCTELCMQREVFGARLHVIYNTESGLALVEVPWIASIFRTEPGLEDILTRFMFERGEVPPLGTPGVSLQPSLFKTLDITGADRLMVSGALEQETVGFIERDGRRESLKLRVRKAGNMWAFISESGLVLAFSNQIQDASGAVVHSMEYRLSAEFGRTLDTFHEFDAWLRLLGPGAKIRLNDSERGIDISDWGPDLERIGDSYQQIMDAFTFASLPLSIAQLADLADDEFARSVAILSALARGVPLPSLLPGFLIGPAADDKRFQEHLERCKFQMPIVLNVKSYGVTVWLTGSGRAYVDDQGTICGFFPDTRSACSVELRGQRFTKESNTPEVWVYKYWPAIRLLEAMEATQTFTSGVEHELEGRIWFEGLH